MTKEQHTLICITGLGDQKKPFDWLSPLWEKHGLSHLVFDTRWQEEEDFESKLARLLILVRNSLKEGKVSVLGTSAGGSAALIALSRESRIHRAVNVNGRLRAGKYSVRSLENASKASSAFYQSVKTFEQLEPGLTQPERQKVMTIRPRFGDQVVPSATVTLEGAQNRKLPVGEHMVTILLALTLFSGPILKFIKED